MEVLPIDLTSLLAVFLGTSIVLIPVLGATARFALKPTVEAVSKLFEQKGENEVVMLLERRCALLEQQVEMLENTVGRIGAATEFDKQLNKGGASASADSA